MSGARPILVADDDGEIRALFEATLSAAGYALTVVSGGVEALDEARARRPALVVLDVQMPDLDGLTVCRALRGDDRTADVPVLLVSALGDADDVTAGLAAGADDYLTKPFSPRELARRVHALLDASTSNS